MKRHLYIVLFPFLLAGCFSPVKQGWNDFTAYYNTFYNAKQVFNEGLELNNRQQPDLDISRPIRIHTSPTDAGHEEFERAIEKGASILRDHSESSYVSPALSLIGQSYFYRQEYFSALEKFQELAQFSGGRELQDAIIWQGRTYLEMELYGEGIRVLNQEIDYVEDWDSDKLAQVQAVLAQLYVGDEDWDAASAALHASAGELERNQLQARAYFLHGQVQERLGNEFQALAAYRLSSEILTEYGIEFNSRRKLAEMYRETGDFDAALSQYRTLERDDKFLEFHSELRFEIAKTYHEMNDSQAAISRYNEVLSDRFDPPSNRVKGQVYYGLAEIYRNQLNNFQMAAAYYDSANSFRANLPDSEEPEKVDEIARAFGEYASIKQDISHIDSLLTLAEMTPAELDSVLLDIREEMEAESDEREAQLVINESDITDPEDAVESVEFGFLNINDPARLEQASMRFRAIWGDRPLVDNWRRQGSILVSVIEDERGEEVGEQPPAGNRFVSENGSENVPGVDLSEIPFEEPQRQQALRNQKQLKYRLGNLFFLSLNMPDSARIYFDEVIESSQSDDLKARAIYSMAELELEYGNRREAERYSNLLFENYPSSIFAERLEARLGLDQGNFRQIGASDSTLDQYYLMQEQYSDTSYAEKAKALRKLSEETDNQDQKVIFLYESAENYIKAAKSDSTASDDPDHEYFESARTLLEQISEIAPGSRHARLAESLKSELDGMKQDEGQGVAMERFPEELYPSDPAGELPFCSEANAYLDLPGGAARVIDELGWSEEQRSELPQEIGYRFAVRPDGSIEDFSLLDSDIPESVESQMNEAIRELSFEPIDGDHSIRCRILFPVRQ